MLRALGVILICFSTTMIGFRASTAINTRHKVLSSFISAIDFMIAEVSCLLTPLEEILEKLVAQSDEPARRFFYQCFIEQKEQKDIGFSEVWLKELKAETNLCLRVSDIQLLSEIGTAFGHYSSEELVRILVGIREKLISLKTSAQEECAKNGKLYRNLGITGGIALAILMI